MFRRITDKGAEAAPLWHCPPINTVSLPQCVSVHEAFNDSVTDDIDASRRLKNVAD